MVTNVVAMGLGWDVGDYTQIQIANALFDSLFPKADRPNPYDLLSTTLAPIYAATVAAGAAQAGEAATMGQAEAAPAPTLEVASLIKGITSSITSLFGSSRPSGAEKRAAARKGSGPVIAQVKRAMDGLRGMVQQRGRSVPGVAPPAFTEQARLLLHAAMKKYKVKGQPWRWDIGANMLMEWAEKAAQELSKTPAAPVSRISPAAPPPLPAVRAPVRAAAPKPPLPAWVWPVGIAAVLGVGFLAVKAIKG